MTVCRDVTKRKEAEDALRRNEEQLHALVARLNTVQEEEAKRIARRFDVALVCAAQSKSVDTLQAIDDGLNSRGRQTVGAGHPSKRIE